MESPILQSAFGCFSSLDTAFSAGSINRYRFASASPHKPLLIRFTQRARTRAKASCVLSMSKKCDDTDSSNYNDFGVYVGDDTDSSNYDDFGMNIDTKIKLKKMGFRIFGDPVPQGDYYLVARMGGVGTKLKLAVETGLRDTVGIDLVAMSVNDLVTCGAEPGGFVDYYRTSLSVDFAEEVTQGILDGCKQSGCALIGEEDGKYTVAGDVLIGLPSSGLHCNGFSLVRSVVAQSGFSLKDELPSGSSTFGVKGIAHITRGGFTDNISRILPDGLGAAIHTNTWEVPPLFNFIQKYGNVEAGEMRRTFNMGIGMVMVVNPEAALRILGDAENGNYVAYRIGEVVNGEGVIYH